MNSRFPHTVSYRREDNLDNSEASLRIRTINEQSERRRIPFACLKHPHWNRWHREEYLSAGYCCQGIILWASQHNGYNNVPTFYTTILLIIKEEWGVCVCVRVSWQDLRLLIPRYFDKIYSPHWSLFHRIRVLTFLAEKQL